MSSSCFFIVSRSRRGGLGGGRKGIGGAREGMPMSGMLGPIGLRTKMVCPEIGIGVDRDPLTFVRGGLVFRILEPESLRRTKSVAGGRVDMRSASARGMLIVSDSANSCIEDITSS